MKNPFKRRRPDKPWHDHLNSHPHVYGISPADDAYGLGTLRYGWMRCDTEEHVLRTAAEEMIQTHDPASLGVLLKGGILYGEGLALAQRLVEDGYLPEAWLMEQML